MKYRYNQNTTQWMQNRMEEKAGRSENYLT